MVIINNFAAKDEDMTRKEFSDKLAQLRVERGVSKYAVCKHMERKYNQLWRIEGAEHNYTIAIALKFLEAIKYHLVLVKSSNRYIFNTSENFVEFFKNEREDVCSKLQLSKIINKSPNTIHSIEIYRRKLTIDIFLAISEALGFTIEFEPYD